MRPVVLIAILLMNLALGAICLVAKPAGAQLGQKIAVTKHGSLQPIAAWKETFAASIGRFPTGNAPAGRRGGEPAEAADPTPDAQLQPGATQREVVETQSARRGGNRPNATAVIQAPSPEITFPTIPDTGFDPADGAFAAGPAYAVAAANRSIEAFTLQGGSRLSNTLAGFFGDPTHIISTPRVVYDAGLGRFIVVASGHDAANKSSRVYVAVSNSGDPAGQWNKYAFAVSVGGNPATHFLEYPSLGYDQQVIYATFNLVPYDLAGPRSNALITLDKFDIAFGVVAPRTYLTGNFPLPAPFANFAASYIKPAEVVGSVSSGLLVAAANRQGIALYKVTDPLNRSLAFGVTASFIDTTDWNLAGNAPSAGTSIQTGDDRLHKTVYRSGAIWTCHTTAGTTGFGSPAQVRFYKLDPQLSGGDGVLLTAQTISDASLHFYHPSLMPTPDGHVILGFHGSNSGTGPNLYHAKYRDADQALSAARVTVPAKSASFLSVWGSHTDASLDVASGGLKVWLQGQIPTAPSLWELHAARVATRSIELLSPNGGETFLNGETVDIRWTPGSSSTNGVRIEVSYDGGTTWQLIGTTADDGQHNWTAVAPPDSVRMLMRIRTLDTPTLTDVSDAQFTVTRGTRVTFCTDGMDPAPEPVRIPDNWRSNADWAVMPLFFPQDMVVRGAEVRVHITHPYRGDLEVALIPPTAPISADLSNLSIPDLERYGVLLHDETGLDADWQSPTTYPTPTKPAEGVQQFRTKLLGMRSRAWDAAGSERPWRLLVRDLKPGDIGTINKWCLTVIGPETQRLSVVSPNGGERWEKGSTQTITWTNDRDNPVAGDVQIQVSRDSGTTWTTLATRPADVGTYTWTNVSPGGTGADSQTVRVRVQSVSTPSQSDDSDADFSIVSAFVRVIQPNGGERVAVGQPYEIKWDGVPNTSPVEIRLSTDGGATYPTVLAQNLTNTGLFTWNVPADFANTDTARVKVTTASGLTDSSDANFSIKKPAVTITEPVASDIWYVQTQRLVKFTTNGVTGNVRVELDRGDGNGWQNLGTTTAASGQFAWTVSGTPTSQAQVRVTSVNDPTATATSPVFQIRSITITVAAPAAGARLAIGSTATIRWSNEGLPTTPAGVDNVDIDISRNGGPWERLFTNVANTGSRDWTVTGPVRDVNQIRVRSRSFTAFGLSGEFAIVQPTIQVLAPNGGERVPVGRPYRIEWSAAPPSGTVTIKLSRDSGATYPTTIASGVPAGDLGYTWTPAVGLDTTTARIQISVDGSPFTTQTDTSNADFTIETPRVTLQAPNGGEVWYVGTTQSIQWDTVGVAGDMKIQIDRNDGAGWTDIATVPVGNRSYTWTVAGAPAIAARMRVVSVANPADADESDATFEIRNMTISVLSPAGGEIWGTGNVRTISWTSDGVSGNVDVLINRQDDAGFVPLFTDEPSSGSRSWTVAGPASNNAVIRVQARNFPVSADSGAFSIITSGLEVLRPTNSDELRVGQDFTITWTSAGISGNVKIELRRNGTWETLFDSVANTGSKVWRVAGADAPDGLIKITSVDVPSITGTSETFRIVTPGITLRAPNGGERIFTGTTRAITWTSQGVDAGASVRIELNRNDGAGWQSLGTADAGAGTFSWNVSGNGSNNARVRLTVQDASGATDTSDAAFTIVVPSIRVLSPNGGQEWLTGSQQRLTWTSDGVPGKVNVYVSYNNGADWTRIFTGTDNDGSEDWTVPSDQTGTQVLVRVTSTDNEAIQDQSDATFTISGQDLRVTAPAGRSRTLVGGQLVITWEGSVVRAGGGTVEIQLARDGRNFTTIIPDAPNTGAAVWPVTGRPSNRAIVRVIWKPNPTVQDDSDAFRIEKPRRRGRR